VDNAGTKHAQGKSALDPAEQRTFYPQRHHSLQARFTTDLLIAQSIVFK
jgi:hypothetical protein